MSLHGTKKPQHKLYEQAGTYHGLVLVSEEQREWEQARQYYEQALQIYMEFNDRYEQAGTYHQLGMVAQEQGQWEQAEERFLEALSIFAEYQDMESGGIVSRSLVRFWNETQSATLVQKLASLLGETTEEIGRMLQGASDTPLD